MRQTREYPHGGSRICLGAMSFGDPRPRAGDGHRAVMVPRGVWHSGCITLQGTRCREETLAAGAGGPRRCAGG